MEGGRWFFGVGYTGNGVGPSHLGGKILASLCLDEENEWTGLPLVNWRPLRYPPQPLRSVGARMINEAVLRKDRQEERTGRAATLTDFVARLPAKFGFKLPPESCEEWRNAAVCPPNEHTNPLTPVRRVRLLPLQRPRCAGPRLAVSWRAT